MTVRRAVAGDEPMLRELRLQAMTDAPEAFGSTYEREMARTTADWQRWLSPGVSFILETPDGPRGIVAGGHDDSDPAIVHLMAMWVHPELRGTDAADALLNAVIAWAQTEAATVVRLEIVEGNDRARRFYERSGFKLTGRETVREGDRQMRVQMERGL